MKGGAIMPHVAITMIPGRNDEQKKEIAQKVQAFLAEELKLDAKYVSVSVEDIPVADWSGSMEKFSDDILYVKPGV